MKAITRHLSLFLLMSVAAVMVMVYMSMYQLQKDKWSRMMRDIPTSADGVLKAMKGHVPDEFLIKLQTWAATVEGHDHSRVSVIETPREDPWDAEQTKRKQYIKKICYEVREAAEVSKPGPQDMLRYMVLDNVDNVVFCPSLEDTQANDWQKVLEEYAERALRLEKYARGEEEWEDARDEVSEKWRSEEDKLVEEGKTKERDKFSKVMNAQSVQEVLGSYYVKANTKVLLVEHPFERLLSFYLETIRDKVGKTGEDLSKKIINIHFKGESNKIKKKKQVSFPQFMHYLLFRVAYDPHLKALYHICHPCDIEYDYIIKMETFHEDVYNINKRLGIANAEDSGAESESPPLPDRRRFPYFNLTDEAWVQEMLYSRYSKIKSDNLLQAFDLFSIDIFLFNYSWPFENLSLIKDKKRGG